MLLSPGKNGLTSVFQEVMVVKVAPTPVVPLSFSNTTLVAFQSVDCYTISASPTRPL